jgi:CRP-like cAMP-binding protein
MFDEELKLLRALARFKEVDTSNLKLMAMAGERVYFDAGEVMIEEGARSDSVYIIMSGVADVTRSVNGVATSIGVMDPGAIVGEIGVVLNQPRFATLTARTPLTALHLEASVYVDLVKQLPQLAIATIRELSQRLVEITARYSEAQAKAGPAAETERT